MREAGKSTAHIAVADDTSTTILTPHAAAIIDRLAGNDALAILGAICAAYEAGLHDGKAVEPWRAREMALDARAEELDCLRPPPSREETLPQRDRVIFSALDGYGGPMTNRARDLASDLRRARGLRGSPSSDRMRVACEILRLNDGRTLAQGQIYQIWRKLNFSMSSHFE